MKKIAAFLIGLAVSSTSYAFEQGSWKGEGKWISDNGYQAPMGYQLTIEGDAVMGHWTLNEERNAFSYKIAEKSPGFYNLTSGSEIFGTAYCIEEFCHYSGVAELNSSVEETLIFEKDHVRVVGSRKGEQFSVSWTAILKPEKKQ